MKTIQRGLDTLAMTDCWMLIDLIFYKQFYNFAWFSCLIFYNLCFFSEVSFMWLINLFGVENDYLLFIKSLSMFSNYFLFFFILCSPPKYIFPLCSFISLNSLAYPILINSDYIFLRNYYFFYVKYSSIFIKLFDLYFGSKLCFFKNYFFTFTKNYAYFTGVGCFILYFIEDFLFIKLYGDCDNDLFCAWINRDFVITLFLSKEF